jgi:thiamine kinase-like enzyme
VNERNLRPQHPFESGPDSDPGSNDLPIIRGEICRLIGARVEKLQKLEDFVHSSIQEAIKIAIQTGEFSQAFKIEDATNVRYTVEIDFLPGAKDFTSILRLVTISLDLGDGTHVTVKMVAKLAFDKTQPRILQDPSALDSLNKHLSDKTREEFERTQVLQGYLKERILPKGFFCVPVPGSKGTVVFYELIKGSTLEGLILSSLTSEELSSLFSEVGQQLATWHSSLGSSVKEDSCFTNRTDRIEAYKRKFPDFESLSNALITIFNKWVSTKNQATPAAIFHKSEEFTEKINIIWSKINQHLAEFKDSNNGQLVLCHGDFKPENIIVQNTGQPRVFFIDNDAFRGPPALDLFKMVSRIVPILLKHPELKDRIVECLNSFLTSYLSHRKDNHFNLFNFRLASVFIALDLLSILDSYSVINPRRLEDYPLLSQVFFDKPHISLTSLLNAINDILNLNLDDNSNSFGRLLITNK